MAVEALDRVLPDYDFRSHHETAVAASPERTVAALEELDTQELLLTRALMGVRSLPGRVRGRAGQTPSGRAAFTELARGERSVVVGLVGQFWKPVARPLRLEDGDAFRNFSEPGFAKAAMGFEVRAAPNGSRLVTETRIKATDAAARRSFGRYWLLIRAGSGLIRRDLLRAVRRTAEHG
jgi:hypothetical protein